MTSGSEVTNHRTESTHPEEVQEKRCPLPSGTSGQGQPGACALAPVLASQPLTVTAPNAATSSTSDPCDSAPCGSTLTMPVANPVTDDLEQDLPQAEEFAERENKAGVSAGFLFGMGVLVLLVVAIIVVAIMVVPLRNNDSPAVVPSNATEASATEAPVLSPEDHLKRLLPSHTLQAMGAGGVSPQSRVFQWVSDGP